MPRPTCRRLLALSCGALLLAGCFAGRVKTEMPFEMTKAEQLEVGTSTKADVLRLLGAPTSITRLWRGEAYVYEHTVGKRSGLWLLLVAFYRDDTQRDAITVVVGDDGKVEAVGTRQQAEKAAFGTPWGD